MLTFRLPTILVMDLFSGSNAIPSLTVEQMLEVDRLMEEVYGIDLPRMMENAGRNLARLARSQFLGDDPMQKRIAVLAGTGGNAGGALVAARHLHNWGARVRLYLNHQPERLHQVTAQQFAMLKAMGLPIETGGLAPGEDFDLILDGLVGYHLDGAPDPQTGHLIQAANDHPAPVLANDVPSGIDLSTGVAYEPAIFAKATLTLALPKTGLFSDWARPHVGDLFLADISVPPGLYRNLGLEVPSIFSKAEIIQLR